MLLLTSSLLLFLGMHDQLTRWPARNSNPQATSWTAAVGRLFSASHLDGSISFLILLINKKKDVIFSRF